MDNIKKHWLYSVLYNVGFMFCSGAILQTFFLQVGFSEEQVYLFNSFIQIVQVIMMLVMTFFTNKVKNVKALMGISYLSLSVLTIVFLLGALFPTIRNNVYIIVIFIVAGISYVGVGIYTILGYVLPYYTIDMKDYPKMVSIGTALSGGVSWAFSFIHAFIVAKFDYMQSTIWFFVLAIICFILTSAVCWSLKEKEDSEHELGKKDWISVFMNKDTYVLLFPNFARGLAAGIMGVITVIAMSSNILNEKTSSVVNILMQMAMLGGNLCFAFFCKKTSSQFLLLLATIGCSVVFPFCITGEQILFFVLFFIAYFFRMIIDTAIPIMVTEIIPQEQIGAYTSIRMLIFTAAQAVATLIIVPLVNIIGYFGLLIFASIMQFICGFSYYIVAKKKKEKKIF